jgi:hypothetical protein
MFLRVNQRKKNGKLHRYWSIVESRRLHSGNPAQRQVLYLGEINDSQEAAWRKTIEVFDEQKSQSCQVSLFPCDREIPPDQVNALSLVLAEMRLVRPRSFGDCWLGCLLWQELGLDHFWQEKLGADGGGVPWDKVVQLLAVNRLCEPGSEFALHRAVSSGTVARWTNCWAATSRWPGRTGSIVAWTGSCRTRTSCAGSWWAGGRRCSTLRSTCCCTT